MWIRRIKKFVVLLSLLGILGGTTWVFGADVTKAVTVGTNATQIVGLNVKREVLVLYNNGTAVIKLGFTAADCTTASALPLVKGAYVKFYKKADPIYGIVDSGTQEIRVWEDEHP